MALVRTTPLGARRNGVGGMLTAGTVGVSRKPSAPAPKPAPKPEPKKATARFDEEPMPDPAPKPTKARFDDEVVAPLAPAAAWPSEARYVTKAVPEPVPTFPSEARVITQGAPQPAPTWPSEERFITKVVPAPAPHGRARRVLSKGLPGRGCSRRLCRGSMMNCRRRHPLPQIARQFLGTFSCQVLPRRLRPLWCPT